MYIHFFHGRQTINQEMNDWGEDGPIVEITSITSTYGSLSLHDKNTSIFLNETEGLIPIGNKYYGDFEILANMEEISTAKERLSLEEFQQLNKVSENAITIGKR